MLLNPVPSTQIETYCTEMVVCDKLTKIEEATVAKPTLGLKGTLKAKPSVKPLLSSEA